MLKPFRPTQHHTQTFSISETMGGDQKDVKDVCKTNAAADGAWKDRVEKERKALNKHLFAQFKSRGLPLPSELGDYDPGDVAPLHDLHRSLSLTSFDVERLKSAGAISLPKIDLASGRGGSRLGTGLSRTALAALAACGERPDSRPLVGSSHSLLRSASAALLQSPDTMSLKGSVRSGLSGLTAASLRREVQDAVQLEVAKVVQPLKEKLQQEQSTRQRLEELLAKAQGERKKVTPSLMKAAAAEVN